MKVHGISRDLLVGSDALREGESAVADARPSRSARPILDSVFRATAFSLLLAAYVFASESFHLVLKNRHFLFDLGAALFEVLAWYIGFAVVIGVIVGGIVRSAVWQCYALSFAYFGVLSLKMFWLDAPLLALPSVAVAFAVFTAVTFGTGAWLLRRFALPSTSSIIFVIAYFHVCHVIASAWATIGGRLFQFLLAPRTIIAGAIGVVACVAAVFVLARLERRFSRATQVFHGVGFAVIIAGTLLATRSGLSTPTDLDGATSVETPDLYVLSFDAMRTDTLAEYVKSHPNSKLADLVARGTEYRNVITEGASTYSILANNTFAGGDRKNCRLSVPGLMRERNYATMMLFGRYGKRFEGSSCYDYYYSGAGITLARRYAILGLTAAFTSSDANASLRGAFMPSQPLVDELQAGLAERSGHPVFAYVHFLAMHAPYVPSARASDDAYLTDLKQYMKTCYRVACNQQDPENARLIRTVRDAYETKLDDVDEVVARVTRIAEARSRPFLIVITADHGELFGEHGGFAHSGGFVRELLNVPFVVFDSRGGVGRPRCNLMSSHEALRATALLAATGRDEYPDQAVLTLAAPPLGAATIDRAASTIEYQISAKSQAHSGTWRNIHSQAHATASYPLSICP